MPIELSQKQTEAFELAHSGKKSFILYGGAIRGGKTWWLLVTFISFCSRWPKSRWVIVRESLPRLQSTTFVSFEIILDRGVRGFIKHHDKQQNIYTFKNGSQIIFFSENYDSDKDLDRFKGLEVNGFGAEEISELQKKTFYKMFERAGSWNEALPDVDGIRPKPIVLATVNPTPAWPKEIIYDPWREGTLNPQWAFIPAIIDDNPNLPEGYKDSLNANMPALDRMRFLEGDWDVAEVINPFAYAYNASVHESADAVFNPDRELFISIDFNLNPFGVIFGHIWIDRGRLFIEIFDEISIDNGNTSEMINRINALYGRHNTKFNLTGDAAGNSRSLNTPDNASNFLLLKRGLKLRDGQLKVYGNPTHSNSRSDVNWILHNASVKINPKTCPNLCRDMRFVECDSFGEIIKRNRNDPNQRADHLDCFRYAINTWCTKYIRSNKKY